VPILEVAASCGYGSHAYFSKAYREHYGHTPSDEREARHTWILRVLIVLYQKFVHLIDELCREIELAHYEVPESISAANCTRILDYSTRID
jgi:hypothetical protein